MEGETTKETLDGVNRIAAERARQVHQEGWTPEHDDEHDGGELAAAASYYAAYAAEQEHPRSDTTQFDGPRGCPYGWPWDPSWWKPSDDPVRNLEKAGALIAAEIDRIQRREDPDDC